MQRNKVWQHFFVLTIIFTVGFGCKFLKNDETIETKSEIKTTAITKETLEERLISKGVKLAPAAPTEKPNPLILHVKFSNRNDDFLLNIQYCDSFDEMATLLSEIFKRREEEGVLIEGTNDVYKKITLPAYQNYIDEYNAKNIFIEDFEKLVDDFRDAGFDQIELDIDERNFPLAPVVREKRDDGLLIKRPKNEKADSIPIKPGDVKTISGGVINGKAVNLPKPVYSPAAKAVRADGAVNVRVTVDENGDVVSAEAISGHPMLRASAMAAARAAKFKPTILSGKPVRVEGTIVYNFTHD